MSMVVNGVTLSDRTTSYLETVLWSGTVSLPCMENELVDGCMDVDENHPLHDILESDPLDSHFSFEDFTAEALRIAEKDVSDWFDRLESTDLYDRALEYTDDDHIAHDFWLTRNGHGAGYWDGDYSKDDDTLGDELTTACEAFRERDVYIGDDCKLHFS